MAKRRSDPARQRFPGLTGALVVDTVRGKIRIRKWPRKRGTPKSPAVRQNNADFTERRRLTKFADARQQVTAMDMAKGTGLYPSDILMRAMSVGLYNVHLDDGTVLTHRRDFVDPVAFQGLRLELTADQITAINTWTPVNWPLPVIDTASFFDPGNTTVFTIPNGVTAVRITVNAKNAAGGTQTMAARVLNNAGTQAVEIQTRTLGAPGVSADSGFYRVTPGDVFTPQFFRTAGTGLTGAGRTNVTVEILEAS